MAGMGLPKMPKIPLLKGNSSDIISSNINSLKGIGLSHPHATHLALKVANMKMPRLAGISEPRVPSPKAKVTMPKIKI